VAACEAVICFFLYGTCVSVNENQKHCNELCRHINLEKTFFNTTKLFEQNLFQSTISIVRGQIFFYPTIKIELDWNECKTTHAINQIISSRDTKNLADFVFILLNILQTNNKNQEITSQNLRSNFCSRFAGRSSKNIVQAKDFLNSIFNGDTFKTLTAYRICQVLKKHTGIQFSEFLEQLIREFEGFLLQSKEPFLFVHNSILWIILPGIVSGEKFVEKNLSDNYRDLILQTYEVLYNNRCSEDFPIYLRNFLSEPEQVCQFGSIENIIVHLHIQSGFGL